MHRAHLVALLGALTLVLVPLAHGAGGGVVISQVYAGGGNSGATYANDYVELLNPGSSAVDLTGWTLQYASAASSSWTSTPLTGSIAPGRYYLVQLASAGATGAALPAADATGTTNLASAGGKVALVRDATALTCGLAAGSCAGSDIADFVGWGTAADYEGTGAAPALSSTTAAVRADGGCTDAGSNATDFAADTPAPRNTSSPAAAACGGGSMSGGGTADASVAAEISPLVSIALDRPAISFGTLVPGTRPTPAAENVTVVSNDAAGYALTVHRTAFVPADLPLGIAVSPSSTLLGVPVSPTADLLLGGKTAATTGSGDVWPLSVGLTAPVPVLGSGHYTATVTFTVIGK